jgi:hypothetical protein
MDLVGVKTLDFGLAHISAHNVPYRFFLGLQTSKAPLLPSHQSTQKPMDE